MDIALCRSLAVVLLSTGTALSGRAALQRQFTLAEVHDSLLHAEIAALGAYPELEGDLPDVLLHEVPLLACSGTSAVLDGADVTVELGTGHGHQLLLSVVVDDSVLVIPDAGVNGLRAERFCAWDEGLQLILPFCSAARSADGARVYVHLITSEGRGQRLLTWVFEEGRYLFRVEEDAAL